MEPHSRVLLKCLLKRLKARLHYKLALKPSWLEPVPQVHTETSSTIEMLPKAA